MLLNAAKTFKPSVIVNCCVHLLLHVCDFVFIFYIPFSAVTLLLGHQEEIPAC